MSDLQVGQAVVVQWTKEQNPFWGRRKGRITAVYGDQHVVNFHGLQANFLRDELALAVFETEMVRL